MQKKLLGGLKTLDTNILSKDGKSMNIEMRDLALFVGLNGSGKTLVLIQVWILNYITNTYIMSNASISTIEEGLQFLFDKSFNNNDFTGTIRGEFDLIDIQFDINNGKVSNLVFTCKGCDVKDIQHMGTPIFMSTSTRLFTEIIKYIKTKELLGVPIGLQNFDQSQLEKLCSIYKIYDIIFIERLLEKLSDPFFKMNDNVKKTIKEEFKKDIVHIFYDDKNKDIIITEDKNGNMETYSVTKMSNGEQSYLNMLIQY